MKHVLPPIACASPLVKPRSVEDVLAQALSVIRGRVFGKRATEVGLIMELLRQSGFEIVKVK